MKKKNHPSLDGYDPNRLFNALIQVYALRNDARLARTLEVPFMLVKKMRNQDIPVTPALLIRMEEVSGWSARTLRDLMGDRRRKFRFEEARTNGVDDIISEIYATDRSKNSMK